MKYINKRFLLILVVFLVLLGISIPRKASSLNKAPSEKKSLSLIEKAKSIFDFSKISEKLQGGISEESSALYILLIAFLIGILTSFTPCIYPMIPITLGILQTQASGSVWRNFLLSFSYVLGISTVYAILGYFAATTTLLFGQWLSNPWLVFIVIMVFIYLSFSMFGFYEIKLPSFLEKRKDIQVKGSFLYSFLFGAVSGTVASPCLTPALAVILGFVAKTANPILGFFTMFSFALGIGVLLIAIGTFSTTASFLPKSGRWMLEIKKIFGFILLAVCIYLLQPFIVMYIIFKIYAALALAASIYYFIVAKGNLLKIFIGIILLLLAIILFSWGTTEKRSSLLAANLKPDKVLVCLSTSKNRIT